MRRPFGQQTLVSRIEAFHTFEVAVSVRIITAEENILLITVDYNVESTNDIHGRVVAEVLPIDVALVAPAQDMGFGMSSQSNGLVQTQFYLPALSCIATRMDWEFRDSTLIPGSRFSVAERLRQIAIRGP